MPLCYLCAYVVNPFCADKLFPIPPAKNSNMAILYAEQAADLEMEA